MWQPTTREAVAPPREARFLPTLVGIVVAVAPVGLVPLLGLDPLDRSIDTRTGLFLIALVYPGWVAATSVRTRSVGPVVVFAAVTPAVALAGWILSREGVLADAAGDLDAFLALALPPALVGAIAYGLSELSVSVVERIDPMGGGGTRRSILAALAGLVVGGSLVALIAWIAFGVVGFEVGG